MDKTRKIIGIGLALFLFCVSIVHFIGGNWKYDDSLYVGLALISLLTSFLNYRFSYYTQIGIMLFGALFVGVTSDNSRYISILIISFSYIGAVSYGFFTKHHFIANVAWYSVVTSIFLVSCDFDILETIKWALLVSFCHIAQWAFMRNIVQRARLADILEKEKLRHALVETVEAGMILSEEIKTRGCENASKG